jgi:hypothetical protein
LGIGASLMGCDHVIGFDIGKLNDDSQLGKIYYCCCLDEAVLDTCWVNLRKVDVSNEDLIHSDVQSVSFASG